MPLSGIPPSISRSGGRGRRSMGTNLDPKVCGTAVRNVKDNGLSGKIAIYNKRVGAVANGKKNTISLRDIVMAYGIHAGALKMDCEGGEYDILLKSENETIRAFSHIAMEYHMGYGQIVRKLRSAGYLVSLKKHRGFGDRFGLLFAYSRPDAFAGFSVRWLIPSSLI